jgi:hydroxyacylglutathione hydrolase
MRIVVVPCLKDNYAYLVIGASGEAAVVDPSESEPVQAAVAREGATLRAIWCTHHHADHVGGNDALVARGPLEVVGHVSDRGRIPAQTRSVEAGETVRVAEVSAYVIHIPGHTLGAVAYVVEAGGECVAFTGDTLFSAGCGRLFEGTPALMHASLSRLAELSPETRVYSGHEYTLGNLRFARHVEPSNPAGQAARDRAEALRARGEPTVGTTIADELAVNPFLRVRSREIRATLGIAPTASDVDAFAAIRAGKDSFR